MKKLILFCFLIASVTVKAQSFQGWERKQAITINSSQISGTANLTDFPLLVTLDHLNSEIVDGGTNSALNGGGDIRFSSDADGNYPLAVEIVEFVTSATPANRKCQIWVKVPTVKASSDTTIYIWYNKVGEMQPASNSIYGSQAVWSNYHFVSHDGLYDSATNQNLTVHGNPNIGVTPYGGNSWVGNGTTDFMSLPDGGIDISGSLSISIWKKNTAPTTNFGTSMALYNSTGWLRLISYGNYTSNAAQTWFTSEPASNNVGNGARFYPVSDPLGWHYFSVTETTVNGYDELFRGDGTATTESPITSGYNWHRPAMLDSILLGNANESTIGGSFLHGELAEARIASFVISPAFSDADYNNMNDPATFATAGTPEDSGYGNTINQEFYTVSNAANISNEINSTTGWNGIGVTTVNSVADTDGSSNYSIEITRGNGSGFNAAQTTISNLNNGEQYNVVIRARKDVNNTGNNPFFFNWSGISETINTPVTGSTYEDYIFPITSDGNNLVITVYACDCSVATDKLYISSVSVIPVNNTSNQAPTAPTLSSTAQTDTTVDLSWSGATDDVAVTGYNVYQNGSLITTLGNVTTYQVTGLTASTSYNFTVTALDAASNESVVSNVVAVTTNSNTSNQAVNLLNTSGWTEGIGSAPGFDKYGMDSENIREMGIGPHGTSVLLWKAVPDSNTVIGGGGWHSGYHNIDHTKSYRFTVWTKKTNSQDGRTFFAFSSKDALGGYTNNLLNGNSAGTNPYFFAGDLQTLDNWYLLVAYVHSSDYTHTSSIGGIYDGITGSKVRTINDFKFHPGAVEINNKVELYQSTNTNDNQFFYGPTLYEINGSEPSIQELINAQPNNNSNSSGGSGVWSLNNQDVYYNNGNVAIGTNEVPTGYQLAVNGKVISEEVKVQLQTNWPDYVFSERYNLPTLKEIEAYIEENGHLQNIPSAKVVEREGLQLGDMNAKLLEKIEELTLYIIQQQKELEDQKEKNKSLENRLVKLENTLKKQ